MMIDCKAYTHIRHDLINTSDIASVLQGDLRRSLNKNWSQLRVQNEFQKYCKQFNSDSQTKLPSSGLIIRHHPHENKPYLISLDRMRIYFDLKCEAIRMRQFHDVDRHWKHNPTLLYPKTLTLPSCLPFFCFLFAGWASSSSSSPSTPTRELPPAASGSALPGRSSSSDSLLSTVYRLTWDLLCWSAVSTHCRDDPSDCRLWALLDGAMVTEIGCPELTGTTTVVRCGAQLLLSGNGKLLGMYGGTPETQVIAIHSYNDYYNGHNQV